MDHLLKPSCVFTAQDLMGLSEECLHLINEDNEICGGIFTDTSYSWLYVGPYLKVFNTKTEATLSFYCFGASIKEPNTKISCVQELKFPGKRSLLIVGLEFANSFGMVCIYDPSIRRVLRAIEVPHSVTFVHVISSGNEKAPFPGCLKTFDGIITIGQAGGDVYIVDLCWLSIQDTCKISRLLDIRNELRPCQLMLILPSDADNLEYLKEVAQQNDNHLAIHINAVEGVHDVFAFQAPDGRTKQFVAKEEVAISHLHYAPQLISLFIGYNFGALQVWNLLSMQLEYTSPVYKEHIPVSFITVQEPIDDPRACCYFWAIYSYKSNLQRAIPIAALFSMSYQHKEYHEGYGYIYEDFQGCCLRFQMDLTIDSADCKAVTDHSLCVQLETLSRGTNRHCVNSLNMSSPEERYTLSMMAWNAFCPEHRCHSYLALFDLNQWYKEQMPDSHDEKRGRNYLNIIHLSEYTKDSETPMLYAHINPESVDLFEGCQKLEEHYKPSSIKYTLYTLKEKELCKIENYGLQRQLVLEMAQRGPLALLHPENFYTRCRLLGLTPLFYDTQCETSNQSQCEFLLSVALERRMWSWLCKCASSWANGSHKAAGLSLDFLLKWAWDRARVLQNNIFEYTTVLFDFSGHPLDSNMQNLLVECRLQTGTLKRLYEHIVKDCADFLIYSQMVLKQKENVSKLHEYLSVLEFMIDMGLLPETSSSYPVNQMKEFYKEHRKKFKGELFIDMFIQQHQSLVGDWETVDDNCIYPAASLQTLLRSFSLDGVSVVDAHILVSYTLLDLAKTLVGDKMENIRASFIKYPEIFEVGLSQIRLVQSFWQMDHFLFEEAVAMFAQRNIMPQDFPTAYKNYIMNTLITHSQDKLALEFLEAHGLQNDKDDVSMAVKVYVSNKMPMKALEIQRRHGSEELLEVFFRECMMANQILAMNTFKFSHEEEDKLFRFMKDNNCSFADSFKAAYFVRRGRFLELYRNNDDCSQFCSVVKRTLDTMLPRTTKNVLRKCLSDTAGETIFSNLIDPIVATKAVPKRQLVYPKLVVQFSNQYKRKELEETEAPAKRHKPNSAESSLKIPVIDKTFHSKTADASAHTPHSILKAASFRERSETPESLENLISNNEFTPKRRAALSKSASVRFTGISSSSSTNSLTPIISKGLLSQFTDTIQENSNISDVKSKEETAISSCKKRKSIISPEQPRTFSSLASMPMITSHADISEFNKETSSVFKFNACPADLNLSANRAPKGRKSYKNSKSFSEQYVSRLVLEVSSRKTNVNTEENKHMTSTLGSSSLLDENRCVFGSFAINPADENQCYTYQEETDFALTEEHSRSSFEADLQADVSTSDFAMEENLENPLQVEVDQMKVQESQYENLEESGRSFSNVDKTVSDSLPQKEVSLDHEETREETTTNYSNRTKEAIAEVVKNPEYQKLVDDLFKLSNDTQEEKNVQSITKTEEAHEESFKEDLRGEDTKNIGEEDVNTSVTTPRKEETFREDLNTTKEIIKKVAQDPYLKRLETLFAIPSNNETSKKEEDHSSPVTQNTSFQDETEIATVSENNRSEEISLKIVEATPTTLDSSHKKDNQQDKQQEKSSFNDNEKAASSSVDLNSEATKTNEPKSLEMSEEKTSETFEVKSESRFSWVVNTAFIRCGTPDSIGVSTQEEDNNSAFNNGQIDIVDVSSSASSTTSNSDGEWVTTSATSSSEDTQSSTTVATADLGYAFQLPEFEAIEEKTEKVSKEINAEDIYGDLGFAAAENSQHSVSTETSEKSPKIVTEEPKEPSEVKASGQKEENTIEEVPKEESPQLLTSNEMVIDTSQEDRKGAPAKRKVRSNSDTAAMRNLRSRNSPSVVEEESRPAAIRTLRRRSLSSTLDSTEEEVKEPAIQKRSSRKKALPAIEEETDVLKTRKLTRSQKKLLESKNIKDESADLRKSESFDKLEMSLVSTSTFSGAGPALRSRRTPSNDDSDATLRKSKRIASRRNTGDTSIDEGASDVSIASASSAKKGAKRGRKKKELPEINEEEASAEVAQVTKPKNEASNLPSSRKKLLESKNVQGEDPDLKELESLDKSERSFDSTSTSSSAGPVLRSHRTLSTDAADTTLRNSKRITSRRNTTDTSIDEGASDVSIASASSAKKGAKRGRKKQDLPKINEEDASVEEAQVSKPKKGRGRLN